MSHNVASDPKYFTKKDCESKTFEGKINFFAISEEITTIGDI